MTRATPLASQINAGAVVMVKGAWNEPFKDECRIFPNGKSDDQVDGAARAFNALLHPQGACLIYLGSEPRCHGIDQALHCVLTKKALMTADNKLVEALRKLGPTSPEMAEKPAPPTYGFPHRPVINSAWFNGKTIYLDGYRFVGCRFDKCTIHVNSPNIELIRCVIDPTSTLVWGDRVSNAMRLYLSRFPWASTTYFNEHFLPIQHPDGSITVEDREL